MATKRAPKVMVEETYESKFQSRFNDFHEGEIMRDIAPSTYPFAVAFPSRYDYQVRLPDGYVLNIDEKDILNDSASS
jgi:hypothetical protein